MDKNSQNPTPLTFTERINVLWQLLQDDDDVDTDKICLFPSNPIIQLQNATSIITPELIETWQKDGIEKVLISLSLSPASISGEENGHAVAIGIDIPNKKALFMDSNGCPSDEYFILNFYIKRFAECTGFDIENIEERQQFRGDCTYWSVDNLLRFAQGREPYLPQGETTAEAKKDSINYINSLKLRDKKISKKHIAGWAEPLVSSLSKLENHDDTPALYLLARVIEFKDWYDHLTPEAIQAVDVLNNQLLDK